MIKIAEKASLKYFNIIVTGWIKEELSIIPASNVVYGEISCYEK